jgi:hypothetical protein
LLPLRLAPRGRRVAPPVPLALTTHVAGATPTRPGPGRVRVEVFAVRADGRYVGLGQVPQLGILVVGKWGEGESQGEGVRYRAKTSP